MADEKENESENSKPLEPHAEGEVSIITLDVLPLIKDAQQHHGLRHGDYQRYRQYCARRLARIRHSLHFSLGTRYGYKGKKLTVEMVTDSRYLCLPLWNAERAWSYAMELKLLANTEPRKKFHMIRKLQKAVAFTSELLKLSEAEGVDTKTKLEVQAYNFWMNANFKFEVQDWQDAVDLYGKARTIYQKLASAFLDDLKDLYLQKVDEIAPNIRYCAYNLGDTNIDINELLKLRTSAAGQDLLAAKLDNAITQMREKLAGSVAEVSWLGRTVPVHNEKSKIFIQHLQEKDADLQLANTLDEKMEVYDTLLMECKDAMQSVREEIHSESGQGKAKGQKNEATLSQLQFVQTYLSYHRHNITVERNFLMIESMKARLPSVSGDIKSIKGRPCKPEDLVKLHDNIIQSLTDIQQLSGVEENAEIQQDIAARITALKGHRCFYIALSYLMGKKWHEAVALFDKVMTYISQATEQFKLCPKGKMESEISRLKTLAAEARGYKYAAHATFIIESSSGEEKVTKLTDHDKPLLERLDSYQEESGASLRKPNLVTFPPDFEPVPCKPLFFDLAFNHVTLPNLEHRLEQKKAAGGITGLVKGWFWGK